MIGLLAGLLVLLAGLTATSAQEITERFAKLKYDVENEVEIRKQYAEFAAAWNRHDAKAMAAFYSLDADLVEPDLQVARGREQIEELFDLEHKTAFKDSELVMAIDSVWFVTENVALVDGAYHIEGLTSPEGKPYPPRKGHMTGLLLREQNRWWVVASRATMPFSLDWREDLKKSLEKQKKKD